MFLTMSTYKKQKPQMTVTRTLLKNDIYTFLQKVRVLKCNYL